MSWLTFSCKVSCIFSTYFSKNAQVSKLMKVRPVGDELFPTDRRKDMTKLIVVLRLPEVILS